MPEYVAFDTNTEVFGRAVNTIWAALGKEILPVLEKYGLATIDPDKWYNQQTVLDLLADLARRKTARTTVDFIMIGMKSTEYALFPPHIKTIPDIMLAMDTAYKMNHRGEAGGWQCTILGERKIEMVTDTPYPDDISYGSLYGFARFLAPPESEVKVVRDLSKPIRKFGGHTTTYIITW